MAFDPNKHLMKLKGKDYLPVAARLVWFREDCPEGRIETEHIEITDQRAVFRATVTKLNADGVVLGTSTGYGSETPKDFGDYIEKAETKSIGRALAALGYGTAFAPEFDEGARIVDTPQAPPQAPQQPRSASKPANTTPDTNTQFAQYRNGNEAPVALTREQIVRALHAEGKKQGIDHDDLHNLIAAKGHESITTAPIEALIDLGKAVKNEPNRLKEWLAQRHLDQQELLPGEDIVPTPRTADSFTN